MRMYTLHHHCMRCIISPLYAGTRRWKCYDTVTPHRVVWKIQQHNKRYEFFHDRGV